MHKITVIIALLISTSWMGVAYDDSAPYEAQWDKVLGGDGYDEARGVVSTIDGGYLLVGYTIPDGYTRYDAWVLKLDAKGNQLWKKTYEDDSRNKATGVVAAKDGGYLVTGVSNRHGAWVKKIDTNGNTLWDKAYTDKGLGVINEIIVIDAGYLLAGNTSSKGAGMSDMWVQKIDIDGNPIWDNTYGGSKNDDALSVVASKDGGYLLVGYKGSKGKSITSSNNNMWVQKIDALGNQVWDKSFQGIANSLAHDVIATDDGGYLVIGTNHHYGSFRSEMWVLKIDGLGNLIWDKTYGGKGLANGTSITSSQDGSYIVAGEEYGQSSTNIWVQKIDALGSSQWSKTYDNSDNDWASIIINTIDGGYVVVGTTTPKGGAKRDVWVLKLMPPNK